MAFKQVTKDQFDSASAEVPKRYTRHTFEMLDVTYIRPTGWNSHVCGVTRHGSFTSFTAPVVDTLPTPDDVRDFAYALLAAADLAEQRRDRLYEEAGEAV
jgi:hypothetical protein